MRYLYGEAMVHQQRIRELRNGTVGQRVFARGWVRSARRSKAATFIDLYDGSCFSGIQVVVPPELLEDEQAKLLRTGAAIQVDGELLASPGGEQSSEIHAGEIRIVGGVADGYPLQKKRHSFEFLREIAHLRLRSNTFGAVMRVRNAASAVIHDFFQERGFLYLHSPIITLSDCEGAGELFRVSSLDAQHPPRCQDGTVDFSEDFFGSEAFLTVSGQLEAEAAALALGDVYTFGPTFRSENSNTSRHLAEFLDGRTRVGIL